MEHVCSTIVRACSPEPEGSFRWLCQRLRRAAAACPRGPWPLPFLVGCQLGPSVSNALVPTPQMQLSCAEVANPASREWMYASPGLHPFGEQNAKAHLAVCLRTLLLRPPRQQKSSVALLEMLIWTSPPCLVFSLCSADLPYWSWSARMQRACPGRACRHQQPHRRVSVSYQRRPGRPPLLPGCRPSPGAFLAPGRTPWMLPSCAEAGLRVLWGLQAAPWNEFSPWIRCFACSCHLRGTASALKWSSTVRRPTG
mmetsp:Transcript_109829/g.261865  ORF Transcript_109829/g.261865 Transcript_109829/m.261865 type:complete len:254 (-) Transcript_109829:332-1093(-)